MQVLVMYHSRSGNTEKLADIVAQGVREVEGVDCVMKPVAEVTREDFLGSEAIIAGSPVYFGTMSAELKACFDNFVDIRSQMGDKIGAAFSTSGDPHGGGETTIFSILQAMLINGMIVVGDPLEATGHYGVTCYGAPDDRARDTAIKLGRRVAQLAKKLK